jgi:hypothetical protein
MPDRSSRRLFLVAAMALIGLQGTLSAEQGSLSDDQVAAAIALGHQDVDLSVRVGTFTTRSVVCSVIMDGPVARIAAAAQAAFKEYRQFIAGNVTAPMRAQTYNVNVAGDRLRGSCSARHIVLQPVGARGLEGVIQPVHEGLDGAVFDHLPDGDFHIVVALSSGEAPKIRVSSKDRAKLDIAAGISSPVEARGPTPAPVSQRPLESNPPTDRELRIVVSGDSKHVADAVAALRTELHDHGIRTTVVPRNEPYDYLLVFVEGDRSAAAAMALDVRGDVAAVAVRGAFTEKGAAEGAGRDLGKKLAAVLR